MSVELIGTLITGASLLLAMWGLIAHQSSSLRAEIQDVRAQMVAGDEALRTDMETTGASLRAEIIAGDEALRSTIVGMDESLRREIKSVEQSLRGEMRDGHESLRQDIRALGSRLDIQDQKIMGLGSRLDAVIDRRSLPQLEVRA